MCMGVYLASEVPLPLVAWDENARGFNVAELSEYELPVKAQFTYPYVYYVGAYTGCSCGFSPTSDEGPEPALRDRKAFALYAEKAVEQGKLQMFLCWDGDWEKEPNERVQLHPADLLEKERWDRELLFAEILKAT